MRIFSGSPIELAIFAFWPRLAAGDQSSQSAAVDGLHLIKLRHDIAILGE